MVMFSPFYFIVLSVGIVGLYAGEAWKRQRTDNQRTCTSLAALWTIAGLIYAVMLIPPPLPPGEPRIVPSQEIMFSYAIYSVFLPAFAVWVLMMLDLTIYVLKTR